MPEPPGRPARGGVGVMLPLDLPLGDVLPYARRAKQLGFTRSTRSGTSPSCATATGSPTS